MANTNSGAPDEAKTADAKAVDFLKGHEIEVDRSRAYSEIHGEHPLGFMQDGLPYDKAGRLHEGMLDTKDFASAKATLERKLKRMAKEHAEALKNPVVDTNNQTGPSLQIESDPDDDVSLTDWAKGKIKLQPHRVYGIAKKRLGKHFHTLREVADEMVKRKMLLEEDVKV